MSGAKTGKKDVGVDLNRNFPEQWKGKNEVQYHAMKEVINYIQLLLL